MWLILAIILIIAGIFFYIRIVSFIDYRRYYKEYEHIFNAHKEIGYPGLTEEQQFDILDNENWSYISNLTKYEFVPTGLLSKYINIDPNRYLTHLRSLNLADKIKFDAQNLQDGFFINETDKGYEYLFVGEKKFHAGKSFLTMIVF